jgi:hypothetical protein
MRARRSGVGLVLMGAIGAVASLVRWGTRWGSTPWERAMPLPGDHYLRGGPASRVVMTRAITVAVPPAAVWPWLAQLGRGAGYYSFDLLDNGGRPSARHLVSWIPAPSLGDASAIGYLRHVEPGVGLTWWVPGDRLPGVLMRMVVDLHVAPFGAGSRVVVRVSGDAEGPVAPLVIRLFRVVDSIMAVRQLLGIRARVESPSPRSTDEETGSRDQYQLYQVIYAGGGGAGVLGREKAALWHRAAVEDGVVGAPA